MSKRGLEATKRESRGLRGSIAEGLTGSDDHFAGDDVHLLKFHGIYQQDDRDARKARRSTGLGKAYRVMVRSKLPGGRLSARQYLAHDALAREFGDGTLRITTRQDLQLHGVVKHGLQASIRRLNETLVTTFGACGDVVRNAMACPLPANDDVRRGVAETVQAISTRFLPRSRAYHEIWLDGERVRADDRDPLYGEAYLPRKFKIAVALPGDNCVDVMTQDVGLVARIDDGRLLGYEILAGGGMGMTHKKPGTFPRLAEPLGFTTPGDAVELLAAVVAVQRDHGDREDRRHARLKYLIDDRGIDWFRDRVEATLGRALAPAGPLPDLSPHLHLGWIADGDGGWSRGVWVENGRIADVGERRLMSALRALVATHGFDVALTPHQDLLLTGIAATEREAVDRTLAQYGVAGHENRAAARLHAMACPALPTCGLALAEAERALPEVMAALEVELARLGLTSERFSVRMTGCPNGCARPYVADLGFVGRSLDRYAILVGGRSDGTRLNGLYLDLVARDGLVAAVRPLLEAFAATRLPNESFGDFCERVGVQALRNIAARRGGVAAHG